MEVILVMFKADGARKEFPLARDRTMIGRTHRCGLRVPLSSVSREHCEIEIINQRVVIRDLGSSNGTYHNNERVQEAVIEAGDEISVGPVIFTVVINGRPANLRSAPTVIPDATRRNKSTSSHPRALTVVDEDTEMQPATAEPYTPTLDMDQEPDEATVDFTSDAHDQDNDRDNDLDDSRPQSDLSGSRCPEPV